MEQLPRVVSSLSMREPTDDVTGVPVESLRLMQNPIRGYDWGSTTTLARLQGRAATGEPEAELWMGAHPSAPSLVEDGRGTPRSLLELVEDDPVGYLGVDCAARFGARLPYLMKVLAIQRPLSIQVHPSAEQAARGFVREEAAGIPLNARRRSYVDADPKPEFLYAVSPFEGLFGLRPVGQARRLLGVVGTPRLAPIVARLASGEDTAVVDAIAALVAWPRAGRQSLVGEIAATAVEALDGYVAGDPERDDEAVAALRWVVRLAQQHPADPLVVAPLLLRLRQLKPGDTVFTPAGVPHAHLIGTAVEIMNCSDNVVRAGLTSKHVDADELLALLDIDAEPTIGVRQCRLSEHEVVWRPPVAEFQLSRVEITPDAEPQGIALSPELRGPQILLCMQGQVTVRAGSSAMAVRAGQSVFVPPALSSGELRVVGSGELFRAATAS